FTGLTLAKSSNFLRIGGMTQVGSLRGYALCPIGPQIQPSVFLSASTVTCGSVFPWSSCPCFPTGKSCHSTCSPLFFAAAFMTLTASGTTSSPISSPSNTPIFSVISLPGSFSIALHGNRRRHLQRLQHDAIALGQLDQSCQLLL